LAWLVLVLAPFVGSTLGVLVCRLPRRQPVVLARSACERCGRVLGAAELVPLLSYLALGGKCRGCGAPIPPFHIAIELAALAVALSVVAVESDLGRLAAGCILGWTLLALAWIDCERTVLPDALTLPLVLAGLAATWLLTPERTADHALGAAAGYLSFRGIAFLYERLRRRSGLGEGDAKLLAAAGAWIGWAALPLLVLAAALAGLGVALLARLGGRKLSLRTAMPFGPFLVAALWAVWLFGRA
jgi:leader peptidase (prepilin peptidase) / N-methyltransferase